MSNVVRLTERISRRAQSNDDRSSCATDLKRLLECLADLDIAETASLGYRKLRSARQLRGLLEQLVELRRGATG